MRSASSKPNQQLRRAASGQVVIESIASIIIFTIMLALVMSITVYLFFQQALVTVAREGARQASLNTAMGVAGTQAAGINTVDGFVRNQIQQLTGQDPNLATVNITPPVNGATPGQRTVVVTITYPMQNPVNVAGFLNALGADGSAFGTIPVSASATMRYEE